MWAAQCLFDIYKSVTFLCTAQCIQIASVTLRRAPHFSQRWIWASLTFPFDFSKNTSKQIQLYHPTVGPAPSGGCSGGTFRFNPTSKDFAPSPWFGCEAFITSYSIRPLTFSLVATTNIVFVHFVAQTDSLIPLGAGPITQTKRRPVGLRQLPMETCLP